MSKASQIDFEREDEPFWFFMFRNEHKIVTVIIQMFLLFAGFVVILGVLYVLLLIIIIFLHHMIFDRDPARIPAYVKNSPQFSSDEEEDEEDFDALHENEDLSIKKPHETKSQLLEDDFGQFRGPSAQRKAHILQEAFPLKKHTGQLKNEN